MKNTILYSLLILFLYGCEQKPPEKLPSKLLTPQQMKNLIIDLSFLESFEILYINRDNKLNYTIQSFYNYIYEKYDVNDSIIEENNLYYANDMKLYEKIYHNALDSINILKGKIEKQTKLKSTLKKKH